ncbi:MULTISPECIES: hypothetical protein [Sphingomonas]|nr:MULTISPECIES: hypothetical protein [Sphingomonas]
MTVRADVLTLGILEKASSPTEATPQPGLWHVGELHRWLSSLMDRTRVP